MGINVKEIKNSLNKKYCVIYGRVSTEREEQEKSLERQKAGDRFTRKIIEDGYTVMQTFSDAETGTDFKRKGFEEMLKLCGVIPQRVHADQQLKNGNYDKRNSNLVERFVRNDEYLKNVPTSERPTRIYCASTSRFCRTIEGYSIISLLEEIGVSCYFLNENIDTADEDNGWKFKLQLMQILDEQQSRTTSEKVKAGMLDSEKENVIRTNGRIYGYEYSESDNSLKIIPEEAEVVKLVYHLYNEKGLGSRQIITELNNRGIKTREIITQKGKKMGGKPFCINSVKRILTNEKYFGGNAKKYDVPPVFSKTRSYATIKDSYMIQMNDRIEPIIDFETFKKAKEIAAKRNGTEIDFDFRDYEEGKIYFTETLLEDTKKAIYRGVNEFTAKYEFTIRCGECFNTMYSDREQKHSSINKPKEEKEYINFFRCSSRKKAAVYKCTNNSRMGYKELRDFLDNELKIMQDEIEDYNIILRHRLLNKIAVLALNELTSDFKTEIERIKAKKQRITDAVIKFMQKENEEDLSETRKMLYKATIDSYEQELVSVNEKLEECLTAEARIKGNISSMFNTLSKIKTKDKYDLHDLSRYTEVIVYHKNGMINRVAKSISEFTPDTMEDNFYWSIYDFNEMMDEAYGILENFNIPYKREYLDIKKFIEAGVRHPEECGDCPQILQIIKERRELEKENEEFFIEEAAIMTQKEFFEKYGKDKDLTEKIISKLIFKE